MFPSPAVRGPILKSNFTQLPGRCLGGRGSNVILGHGLRTAKGSSAGNLYRVRPRVCQR